MKTRTLKTIAMSVVFAALIGFAPAALFAQDSAEPVEGTNVVAESKESSSLGLGAMGGICQPVSIGLLTVSKSNGMLILKGFVNYNNAPSATDVTRIYVNNFCTYTVPGSGEWAITIPCASAFGGEEDLYKFDFIGVYDKLNIMLRDSLFVRVQSGVEVQTSNFDSIYED